MYAISSVVQATSNGDVIIPYVEIGLDQHLCMCQSMQDIIASIDSPVETDCSTNPACTGTRCTLLIPPPFGNHDLETDYEACQDPPGAFVVFRNPDGNVLLAQYFDASDTSVISLDAGFTVTLTVNIMHQNYSMIVQVCCQLSLSTLRTNVFGV